MALLSGTALASSCPVHLVTIEPDGQESEGSKEALRNAFNAGLPLRVGWSLSFDDDAEPEVTHWSDGGFLTEFEGEIFAQLDDIQAQGLRTGTRQHCHARQAQALVGIGRHQWRAREQLR